MLHSPVGEAGDVEQHLVDHRTHGLLPRGARLAQGSGVGQRHGDAIGHKREQIWIHDFARTSDRGIEELEGLLLEVPQGHDSQGNCHDAGVPHHDVILIDLDGTITDSIPGILRCLRQALPTLDMQDLTDEELQTWLGPPLRVTLLERYSRSEGDLDRFVGAYRAEYFGGGEYEFTIFPGMAELLADVAQSDSSLVLATAKPIESATRVLTRAGLLEHFDVISGTELDLMRQDKPSIIEHGVTQLGKAMPDVTAVMIGDRKEDVLGAQHHGITSVGVAWGYADPGELEAVQPDHIVTTADDLHVVLGLA